MDLTRQPPRRPSNDSVAGIVGLARMIDKARGHNAGTLGEFKYGDDSGLDAEVLRFINMEAAEFARSAGELDDDSLGALALDKARKSQAAIAAFNEEHLTREPQDELHHRLLAERVARYAPDRRDVRTVFSSIELDDWGAFRDSDLTREPPRSPYVRSVFGVFGAARMADKARAATCGKLGEYRYGVDSGQDRAILDFLGLDQEVFRRVARANPNDDELSEEIARRCGKSPAEKSVFNVRQANLGRSGAMRQRLERRRSEVAPQCGEIETFFDLQDLDDELSFGLTDLRRHPPRSPFDLGVGGLACLARMIDKFRAARCNCLGGYWYGEDSGLDRAVLEFLGIDPKIFAGAIASCASDEEVTEWLDSRLSGKSDSEKARFNEGLLAFGPRSESQWRFLRGSLARLDSSRTDIQTFAALVLLDDRLTFARLKAGV